MSYPKGRTNKEVVELSAGLLFPLARKHVGRLNPFVAQDIEANGWKQGERIKLNLRLGTMPRINDGNHRLRWLHENGRGSMKVPVEIKITAPGFE